jgi:CelD/BcsL family acetyltransferase involved in cellulose biosynthesis
MARPDVEWIEDERRFEEIAAAWDLLADRIGLPFLTHAWVVSWWRAFRAGRRLRICTVWADGELEGVFPLAARSGRLEALANVHSPVFMPFAVDQAALERVALAALASQGHELVVPALPTEGTAVTVLQRTSQELGRITLLEFQHVSPIIELSGSFAEYRQRMRAKSRAGLDRRRRNLERMHDVIFSVVDVPVDLDDELDRGFAVESSGWKGNHGTAIVSAPETETFYRELARRFAEKGQLRLSSITADGKEIAFDFSLLSGNRLYLLKTGYDEDYGRFSPGLLLRMAIIERCFELGLDAHELLGDTAEWKTRFATSERRHCVLRSFRRDAGGLSAYFYRRRVRPLLKSGYRRIRRRDSR